MAYSGQENKFKYGLPREVALEISTTPPRKMILNMALPEKVTIIIWLAQGSSS